MVRRATAVLLVFLLLVGGAPAIGHAQAPPPPGAPPAAGSPGAGSDAIGATPPRLGYAQGPVAFWRPGAADWAPAQVNTPLVPGDELYTGHEGLVELQVGGRAYVRAWGDTQLGLANQEPDFLQLKVTTGHATLDLRSVDPGRSVEIDTPHGAFDIQAPGYYRVDVTPERTSFTTRRAGRAAMTPAGGQPVAIAPSEEVVVESAPASSVRSFAAPELDVFDRWNYTRTDELLESVSARYVPAQVYGADDLDHHGTWRVVPAYGSIWVPRAVPAGWVPYSTGRWIADPVYGWTWVDTAPWGWAPYHYGRWVFVDGYWAWAPGPIVARPVYAPALVAFFGAPGVSVSIGAPFVSWVALGWGEPVVPWWGRPGFIGRAHWSGWGGPRVVNNVVISRTTVVNVTNITVYRNTTVNNAVVAVRRDGFGRGSVHEARVEHVDVKQLRPVHGRLDIKPEPSSFVASGGAAPARPPATALGRPVVATRPPARHSRESLPPALRDGPVGVAAPVVVPAPKIVPAPRSAQTATVPARPPLGASDVERPRRAEPQRLEATPRPQGGAAPPAATSRRDLPPALRDGPQRATPPAVAPPQAAPAPQPQQAPVHPPQPPAAAHQPPPAARQPQQQEQGGRPLPGEPANRVFPGRSEIEHPAQPVPAASHQPATPALARGAFSPDHGNGRTQAGKPPAPAVQHTAGDDGHAERR
ncbi:MAG TPA: DUF6600 domain-containing protein [Candidatus Binatia bacterium]|nr:DUF6600 domain-containing protein [Candidatus Binatia bacterium]